MALAQSNADVRGARGEDRDEENEEKLSVSHVLLAAKQAGGDGSQVAARCRSYLQEVGKSRGTKEM